VSEVGVLNKPDFLHWEFGNQPYASPVEAQSTHFSYWIEPRLKRKGDWSYAHEVLRACEKLDAKREGKTIALCYTGGVDSELIARLLHRLGLPFEMYFLDIWGLNSAAFLHWSKPFEQEIGKKVRIVKLAKPYFYEEHSLRMFEELGCEYPSYLALTYLFEKIPGDEFIVVGDGDLNRTGGIFDFIAESHPKEREGKTIPLPFASSSVAFWLWARKRQRKGDFYFFSSTPELIASTMEHPAFQFGYPHSETREVIYDSFPEIARRPKTTNWDGKAYRENKWVRTWLSRHAQKTPSLSFWKKGAGTIVDLDSLFLRKTSS
jgi:hypothetical protein